MLTRLTIEQFVIIDRLELNFSSGLTVLTGETGAGKSILLDALGLILGDPPSPTAVRQGAEQSVIEALFTLPSSSLVWKFLSDNGMADAAQKELLIRRILKAQSEDDSGGEDEKQDHGLMEINGRPVDLEFLKKTGTFLCEIHGQHANQSLMDPSNQMYLLDLSASFPPGTLQNVAQALHDYRRYSKEKDEEAIFYSRNIQSLQRLEALAARFEAIGLKNSSIEEIEAEYERLLTAFESSEAFREITSNLIASDGAVKALMAASMTLDRHKNLDPEKMKNLATFLADALKNARAAVAEANRLAPEYDIDTRPLRQYKDKLSSLRKMADELEVAYEDLPAYYEDLATKCHRLRNGRARIAKLTEMAKKAEHDYRRHAHVLTEQRTIAGKALSAAINEGLPPLKLMGAEFKVLVEEVPDDPWTELGFNRVTFTARMNPGMPFSPIAETASGGELARLVLALKVVLQEILTIPTLVFDEVDTGIGGGAAAAVGERLALLAGNTQVLVITHSPQVASRGDQALHVSKKSDGLTTTSVIRVLTQEERIDEVSRMLAGDTITEESSAAAKKLLEEARAAAARRQTLKPSMPPKQEFGTAPESGEDGGEDEGEESAEPESETAGLG